mgnify:CR=1 FL=1
MIIIFAISLILMTTKVKYIYIAVLFAFFIQTSSILNAQELVIERTDVDENRKDFVTATLNFGIKISVKGIQRCKSLSFRLDYNLANYVTFNDYQLFDFGKERGCAVVPIVNGTNASIYIGVGASDFVDDPGFDDPDIILLEFSVSQTIPHLDNLNFNFVNVKAVINKDTEREIVDIAPEPLNFSVHSFVNVWPGDANNDRQVDEVDLAYVFLYDNYDNEKINDRLHRSFKRQSPSTLWTAQRVLAWDELDATYADCDGNGHVTVSDLLIIVINLGKSHSIVKSDNQIQKADLFNEVTYRNENTVQIPLYADLYDPIIGITAKVNWENLTSKYKILGVERSELFPNGKSIFYCKNNENKKYSEIAFISLEKEYAARGKVCYGYLICEPLSDFEEFDVMPVVDDIFGATVYNNIVSLQPLTSIEENISHIEDNLNIINNEIIFPEAIQNFTRIEIYNYLGNLIFSGNPERFFENKLNLSDIELPSGSYFLLLKSHNQTKHYNFNFLR